tara:strand:+ start:424 stop:942 length:519 start_codon:yes stop_codon:yes gene_type:complete
MTSKLKTDVLETVSGSGTIALTNQLSGMTSASVPSGSVVQVVTVNDNTQQATSSTSWVATTLVAAITPSSTSSKILVTFNMPAYQASGGYHEAATIFRGAISGTNLGGTNWGFGSVTTASQSVLGVVSGSYLDSPNTTSSQTYTVAHRVDNGTGYAMINSCMGAITLTEIKG